MPRIKPPPGGGRQASALIVEPDIEVNTQAAEHMGEVETPSIEATETDPSVALKSQIASLERANRDYAERLESERREKLEALKKAEERDLEVTKLQEQTVSSQHDAVNAAIVAAKSEADSAQRDIEQALSLGDGKGLGEAQRKLSRAEARIVGLESGAEELDRQVKQAKERADAPKPEPQKPDPLANYPRHIRQFLNDNPDLLSNQTKYNRLLSAHHKAVAEGYEGYSEDYLDFVKDELGMNPKAPPVMEDEVEDEPTPPRRISAPPSRSVPDSSGRRSNGKVTLSREQKEAAKIAGISEEEYAKGMMRLEGEKDIGNYGGHYGKR